MKIFANWKTTLSGVLAGSGLAGAGALLTANDPKHAAWSLFVAALGKFLMGLFAQDATGAPKA